MGEIADMMLDGTLCEGCGMYLGEDDLGFPQRCPSCTRADMEFTPKHNFNKVKCDECGKTVKETGLAQHKQAKHGGAR